MSKKSKSYETYMRMRHMSPSYQEAQKQYVQRRLEKNAKEAQELKEAKVNRMYTAGMHLADALRLLGKHDESRQIEVWVLALRRELEEAK